MAPPVASQCYCLILTEVLAVDERTASGDTMALVALRSWPLTRRCPLPVSSVDWRRNKDEVRKTQVGVRQQGA